MQTICSHQLRVKIVISLKSLVSFQVTYLHGINTFTFLIMHIVIAKLKLEKQTDPVVVCAHELAAKRLK
jgi:hypothetical protein